MASLLFFIFQDVWPKTKKFVQCQVVASDVRERDEKENRRKENFGRKIELLAIKNGTYRSKLKLKCN